MLDRFSAATLGFVALCGVFACGARTELPGAGGASIASGGTAAELAGSGGAGAGGAGKGGAGQGGAGAGAGGGPPCVDGAVQACGSAIGACKPGQQVCQKGVFGPCQGALGPKTETCNGVDDNCDGVIDDGFGLGLPCQGTGTNQCFDGVTTCDGCKKTGPEKVEICNGIDDNCNGIVDADCEVGGCKPSLLVTGSTPSSPGCLDFPVQAGSVGTIEYPCGGGPVVAQIGDILFTGSVTGGFVTLDGIVVIPPDQTPDGCTWQNHHHIEGSLPSGTVSYFYEETLLATGPGGSCWSPCTETGVVQIIWVAVP